LAKAETEFQNELKVDPESTESLYKLAVISLERSKTDVAAELFGTGAKTHASFGRCRISARASTGAMGNVDSAVTNFQAAVTDSGKSDTETLRQSYLPASATIPPSAEAGRITGGVGFIYAFEAASRCAAITEFAGQASPFGAVTAIGAIAVSGNGEDLLL
jgi:hypothetical protein